ncbi:unnamed protein product [Amaranthus hypochondriacus]
MSRERFSERFRESKRNAGFEFQKGRRMVAALSNGYYGDLYHHRPFPGLRAGHRGLPTTSGGVVPGSLPTLGSTMTMALKSSSPSMVSHL